MSLAAAAALRRLAALGALACGLLLLVTDWVRADVEPATEPPIIDIREVTVADLNRPGESTVLPLPVRSHRAQRVLGAFRASAEFQLRAAPDGSRWVVYVQDFRDGGRLFVNGAEIANVSTATHGVTVRHLQPFLFDIPPGVLLAGRNTLVREWSVRENHLFVPRMALGAKQTLTPIYEQRHFWQYTMSQVSFVFAAIISLILLGLYGQNRGASRYLFAGASALGWAILNLAYFLTPIPAMLFAYWQLLVHGGVWAFTAGGSFYLLQDCGVRNRWYRQTSVAWGVAFFVAYITNFWITGQTFWPTSTLVWHVGLAVLGLYPVGRLAIVAWRQRRTRHLVYLMITLSAVAAGVLDAAAISGFKYSPSNGYLLQSVAPVWFIAICFALITDFSRSLQAQREQQHLLASQLEAQRIELEALHALQQASQEKQVAAQERARVMQDMHDGLGSQLISSLAMARSGELSPGQTYDMLRSCIDDLRLSIDAADQSMDSLPLALGNLRFRMAPRLQAAGITLRWSALDLSDALVLAPEKRLPVLRIIQESITNTLKHANASTLRVGVTNTASALTVDISDDGHGFDIETSRHGARGKGLNSLDKRARMLGARLAISSSPQGTRILLVVPLDAAG